MNEQTWRHIVCAVRGRPASLQTVARATELALDQAARLTFLHVVDAEFVQHATIGPLSVVYRQMLEMVEFVLLILVDRAKRRGVSQVDYAMREGNVPKQVREYLQETRPDAIVIGMPQPRQRGSMFSPNVFGPNVFGEKEYQEFIAELESELNLSVIQVEHHPASKSNE
jgi:nucleotide-binding universal stress UspA family protein